MPASTVGNYLHLRKNVNSKNRVNYIGVNSAQYGCFTPQKIGNVKREMLHFEGTETQKLGSEYMRGLLGDYGMETRS